MAKPLPSALERSRQQCEEIARNESHLVRCELGRQSVGDRCGRGRSLRLESFREERRDHAGEDVAGARSSERRRPEVADDDACAGCSDDRVRALEQHDGAESINRLLRRGEPVRADPVRVDTEEASELARRAA